MRRTTLNRVRSRAALSGMIALVVFAVAATLPSPVAAEGGHDELHDALADLPDGWRLYDGGALLQPDVLPNATPLELIIDYFATGSPAVKWRTDQSTTVRFCTVQSNRPDYLTASEFRDSVERGTEVWSEAEAAVGFNYTGDCSTPAWDDDNGINEIGWDDSRNVVRSPAAGITFGRWADRLVSRDFRETDIILDEDIEVSRACLDSVIAHELGHALGFGHSTDPGDLMVASFDPDDDATCPGRPSSAEVNFLRGLYGTNRLPTIASTGLEQNVGAGTQVSVGVIASDPDGDPLDYSWEQTSGTGVSLTESGSTISFIAPEEVGTTLSFRVEARDAYRHTATAEVIVNVLEANVPPTDAPYLEGLGISADGARLSLMFTESAGATLYRFCATPVFFSAPSCQPVQTPGGEITWDTVLGAAVEDEPMRVFSNGYRDVKVQACNDEGCIQDDPTRLLAGGLRWSAHRIDYDYFALTQDIGAGFQFTIAYVQNMTGATRDFKLYSGSEDDPTETLIHDCGAVAPGDLCLGYLAPGDQGHGTRVTIQSERTGTPIIENRIRVR